MASVVKACKQPGLGSWLGLPTSTAELQASLSPADYVYGQPSAGQLQRLLKQQRAGVPPAGPHSSAPATGFGAAGGLHGSAAPDAAKLAPPADDLFSNQLADLDEDCLRLLLGEDADESGPCASGGAGGSAKGPAGSSEKSSATAEQGPGDADAASRDQDDDIALLFSEARHGGAPSLDALDLHVLSTAPLAASDDGDAASAACSDAEARAAAADAGAGLKRSKSSPAAGAPHAAARGLLLCMDYEAAAESINLELLAAGHKTAPCAEAVAPLLSPIMSFAAIDTPESPDSLASGCVAAVPLTAPSLKRQDSTSKRKRAARH